MKKVHETIIIVLFILISYPYRYKVGSGTISIVDIYLVLAGSLIYPIALGTFFKKKEIKFDSMILGIIIYMFFITFTLIYSTNILSSIRHLLLMGEGLILFILITSYIKTYDDFRLVCKYFTWVGVVSLVLSVIYYYFGYSKLQLYSITSIDLLRSVQLRLGSPAWGLSNYYASILIMFIPLFISQFIDYKKKVWGFISLASLILFLQTWSRGGMVALAITLIVYFTDKKKTKNGLNKNKFIIVFIIFVIIFSTYIFIKLNNELFILFFIMKGDNSRFIILREAFQLIKNKPILGYGIGTTQKLSEYLTGGTHNYYVQSILETGIIGFTLFINMIISFLRASKPLKNYDLPTNNYKIALFSSLLGILINIVFQASFEGVIFVWIFWIFISLIYSIHKIEKTYLK